MLEDRVGEYLDEVAKPFTLEELKAQLAGEEIEESRPVGDAGVMVPDWDLPSPETVDFDQPRFALLAVAAAVVVAVVVGFVATGNREPAEVATELPIEIPTAEEALLGTPTNPVLAFQRPVVVVDNESQEGLSCLDSWPTLRSFFGTSAVAETHTSPGGSLGLESSVFLDLGGAHLLCEERGGSFGSGSSHELYGLPSDFPPVAELSASSTRESGESQSLFTVEGLADSTVEEVRLVVPEVSEQTFQLNGDRFRVQATVESTHIEGAVVEVLFAEGRREIFELDEAGPEATCEERSRCLEAWYQLYLEEAIEADATTQATVLEDFALTQSEYDEAADTFLDCLPSSVGASVVVGSNDAATVSACYQQHLEFIDKARVVLNLTWLGDPDNLDEYLQDDRLNTPTGLRPATRGDDTSAEVDTTDDSGDGLQSPIEAFFGIVVDPHELSEGYGQALTRSTEEVNVCLADNGYGEWTEGVPVIPTPVEFIDFLNMADHLEEFGYGVGGSALARVEHARQEQLGRPSELLATTNEELYSSLDEEAQRALFLVMSNCFEEAQRANPLPNDILVTSGPEDEVDLWERAWAFLDNGRVQADADPSVIDAQLQWEQCVQENGYPYSSREEAIFDLRTFAPSNPQNFDLGEDWETRLQDFEVAAENASAREAELVAIDLQCAEITRVDEITRDVRFAIEQAIIDSDRVRLEALRLQASSQSER